ncbi:MAG: helix-turn-helix transcriptional regulator [Pelagimonas sp.]|uniref:helix-turn-helix transcriptional regulator n=1 Tax=Pelagimonas sp. TaxID=2073170 RepID=UPI003D6BCDB8
MLEERDHVLSLLSAKLDQASEFGGQTVFLCGEAGIGKTSVIEAFLTTLPTDTRRAVGLCDPLHTPRPLGPIRDIFDKLFATHSESQDEWHFFDSFITRAAGFHGQAVLVIEDLHWADQRSLDWLSHVGRRISQLPILLIASYRDDEIPVVHPLRTVLAAIPAGQKSQVTLSPLSQGAVQKISLDSQFSTRQLMAATGGNPFFLNEILNHNYGGGPVPTSVSDAVNAKINALPEEARKLLELVSCFPSTAPMHNLRVLAGPSVSNDLEELCDRRFIVLSGDNAKFRHELARLVAYDRMSGTGKQAKHAQIVSVLLRDGPVAQADVLVHHAHCAKDGHTTLKYAPRAAEQAAALGAHKEAAQHYKSALEFVSLADTQVAAEIYEKFSYEAGLALGIDDAVIETREQAIELWRSLHRPEKVGENLAWLSRSHWYRGNAKQAQIYIEEAIDILETQAQHAVTARGKAFALRAQFCMLQDRMEQAVEWGERAQGLLAQGDDFEMQAHALNTIGTAKLFRGDIEGEPLLRESLRISLEHRCHEQAARVYTNLSECLIELRHFDKVDPLLEDGIAFDQAHDLDAWTYYLIGRKAQLRFEQDRYVDALRICEEILKIEDQTLLMQMPARIVRARASLRVGAENALDMLTEALESAQKINEPQYLSAIHIALIEAAVLLSDQTLAHASVAWFETLESGLLSPWKQGEYLFWKAIAFETEPEDIPNNLPTPFLQAVRREYDTAALGFEAEQSRYLSAWCLSLTDDAMAQVQGDEILAQIGSVAARKTLRQNSDRWPRHGVLPKLARGPYGPARQHPYGLSAKEQAVLALLVQGLSNADIAETMSRSVRTIENHVSSILGKLNCSKRVDVLILVQDEPGIVSGQNTPEN